MSYRNDPYDPKQAALLDPAALEAAVLDAEKAFDQASDLDALGAIWTEETVWAPSLTGGDTVAGGEYIGQAGLARYFTELADVWGSFQTTALSIESVGAGRVLVENRLVGEGRTSGANVKMENWLGIVVDGNHITSVRAFYTRPEALEALRRD